MRLDPWTVRFSLVAVVAALGVAAACGSGSGSTPTPAATPTPTQFIATPGPTESPPQTEYRLVVRESGPAEDVIWRVSPADVTQREEIARIAHREGYSIKATVSPDGTFLAYLTLPETALDEDSSQAEAYLIDLASEGKEPLKVADGIDYQYTPMWSPDSVLLYMRRYAGVEFLAANVSIVRVRAAHVDASPTPTKAPAPGVAPWPGPDPVEVVIQDSVAHVLKFVPIGFVDDEKSMWFLEEIGGTEGGTLVGILTPATTAEVDKLHEAAEAAWYAAQAANQQAIEDALANGLPVPLDTATPAPTPSPDARFVVQLTDQSVSGYSLSPDAHRVVYLSQSLAENGEIQNQTYVADMIAASAAPLPIQGLPAGDFLNPVWYPDGRLTIGVLPSVGGASQTAIVALDLSSIYPLVQPDSGFDVPLAWAPDGSWLAVSHMSGSSQANPGDGRLDLVSINGHRITLIEGAQNSGEDSVVGWMKP